MFNVVVFIIFNNMIINVRDNDVGVVGCLRPQLINGIDIL